MLESVPPQIIDHTESLCPYCLQVIEAQIVEWNGAVYMTKVCPHHGPVNFCLWPDAAHYRWFKMFRFPFKQPQAQTNSSNGCPFDCGLCPSHLRHSTLVEIEVTHRCNLACPVCFMAAGQYQPPPDPSLETIRDMYASIYDRSGPDMSIQLTGGEPTVRRDLPDIIRLGQAMGFRWIEANTNGLVLARQPGYLRACKEAGLSGICLQFDGLTAEVYRQIRGRDIYKDKLQVIENCRAEGVQVVLTMTIIAGINDHQLGDMLDFALANTDVVVGLLLQPAFTSGRFETRSSRPLSMGDVIFMLAAQSQGRLRPSDLWPLGCSHPLCSCATHLLIDGDTVQPLTRSFTLAEYQARFNPHSPHGSVFADIVADLEPAEGLARRGLTVMIENYMDAWNMDLKRLQECGMTVKMADGRTIPFCAYHLTNINGERIYAPWGKVPVKLPKSGHVGVTVE